MGKPQQPKHVGRIHRPHGFPDPNPMLLNRVPVWTLSGKLPHLELERARIRNTLTSGLEACALYTKSAHYSDAKLFVLCGTIEVEA